MSKDRKGLTGLLIVIGIIAILGTVACSDVGCLDNRSSIPYAGFYSSSTMQAITVDSIEIGGINAPDDSLLVVAGERLSQVYLPFRFEYDNTAFFIRYVNEDLKPYNLADTLWFTYTSTPYFASEDCGAMYRYRLNSFSYTRILIDSIAITDSLITNTDIERIKIFFRTSADEEEGGLQ